MNKHLKRIILCAMALGAGLEAVPAGADGFDIQLAYTPLGWSPTSKPPKMAWGRGFMMVDVSWVTPYTDKDEVRYEAWIESASNDWASANGRLDPASGGGWRQTAFLPTVGGGGLKGTRLRLSLDYRPPGYSSAPIRDASGAIRYEVLPAVRPLPPGTHAFEYVVRRCVSNGPMEVVRKPFTLTVAGQVEPICFEGIENGRVYPRLTKTRGEIAFWAEGMSPEARAVHVVVRSAGGVVGERSISLTGTAERLVLPGIPVGGPYTVDIACDDVVKTFTDLYVGDLWIVAGQSNAVGTGGNLSLGRKAVPGVQGLSPRYGILRWGGASDGFFEPTVGAWVTAAQDFHAATGVPVGLIGFASGSKAIDYFLDESREDVLQLKPLVERHGRHAAAFFWYQGESDSFAPEAWAAYGGKLAKLVAAVRRAAHRPDMDVGIVQLGRYLWYQDDHFAPVREAQRQFVLADPHAALYATLPYEIHPGDKIHLTTPGYLELGWQIGRSRVACESTGRFGSPGPMVTGVHGAGPDRRRLVARFTNAEGLTGGESLREWHVTDASRRGFRDGGFVPLTAVKTDAVTGCVTLELAEPPGDMAALSYGYNCSVMGTLRNAGGFPAPAFVKVAVQP
jgi:hypothetical protein